MSKRSSRLPRSRELPASSREFPYRAIYAGEPLRPALPIVVYHARGRVPFRALVDSGADYSVLPAQFAPHLGVDLAQCREEPCITAGGRGTVKIRDIPLEAEVQVLGIRFAMRAAFSEYAPVVLLGRDDFFNEFRVTFDHRRETFRLEMY